MGYRIGPEEAAAFLTALTIQLVVFYGLYAVYRDMRRMAARRRLFTLHLRACVRLQLPLEQAFAQAQGTPGPVRRMLEGVAAELSEGTSLGEAVDGTYACLPPWYAEMIRLGEHHGTLEQALEHILEADDEQERLRMDLLDRLLYPLAVWLVIGAGVVPFVYLFILPKFQRMLADIGALEGRMAAEYIGRAELALGVGFWLTIGVVLFVIALLPNPWGGNLERRYGIYHVRHGVRWVARPFWRRYLHAAAGRWAHTLGMLLEAGSPLPEAMDHARSVEADPLFRRRADEWTERVRRGEALGAVLRSARGLPPALVWQVETAQNGPGLPRALREAGTLVVRQAQGRLSRLVAPLGPLLILTLGLGVSQLALALFAPLVDVILHGGI